MKKMIVAALAWIALVGFASAQPLKPDAVQGLYEGTFKDAAGQRKAEARLVATGKDTYKLLVRVAEADGKTTKVEMTGKAAEQSIALAGKLGQTDIAATCSDARVSGAAFELKRIVRESPTLGLKPPAGATVLLDGKNFDNVTKGKLKDGSEQQWKVIDDAIEVPKGGFRSKDPVSSSFKMHVEFKSPLMPEATGQGRGNSGVYMPCGTEIQVLDSFGMTTYTGGGCGGFYKYKDPDAFDEFSLASAPPGQWQTYDIEYRIEKTDGKIAGKPKITVMHNGIKIHDNFEVNKNAKAGGFMFQDHNNPVQYRNIWIAPLE